MKKFTSVLVALFLCLSVFAENPKITSIGIAGRAVKGFNSFNATQMFVNVAEGEFVWTGYLYYDQQGVGSGSKGFKCKVNSTAQGNEWLNAGFLSLRAVGADNIEVSEGHTYAVDYSQQTTANDFKWRVKQNEDGWYKVIYHTSNVAAVTMELKKVTGAFADLVSLEVEGGTLSETFDPSVISYTCVLPIGTASVTPKVVTYTNTSATGTGLVDVSSGAGVSNIVVTSLDGATTKTYTINYIYDNQTTDDYSHLIVNNNFSFVAPGVAYGDVANYPLYSDNSSSNLSAAWRPMKTNVTKLDDHLEFYGWSLSSWDFLFKDGTGAFINANETAPGQSIGINAGVTSTDGPGAWVNGNSKCVAPEDFEFYQTVNSLPAGTYQLSCLLGVQTGLLTSQRLFANNNVQFYGKETDFEQNKIAGEKYTYAGNATSASGDTHYSMKVYVTVSNSEALKIGIRSGNKRGNGETGGLASGNMYGWFKVDNFRLKQIDPIEAADAQLASLSLSAGSITFDANTYTYNVTLPTGTTSVTPTAAASIADAKVEGVASVDLSAGLGVSLIKVTALDGTSQKIYTINYTVDGFTGIEETSAKVSYSVTDNTLTVKGAEAFAVYSLNGVKIANVETKASEANINLLQGLYLVKVKDGETFKVVIK